MARKNKTLYIGFLGIDGSGKTIQALLLERKLKELGFQCEYIHLVGPPILKYLLPEQYFFFRKIIPDIILDQRSEKTCERNNLILMCLWFFITLLDSILDNLIRRIKIKNGSIIIQDRVFFQKIIEYLNFSPVYLRKLYIRLLPKPDIICYLDLDPKLAYERRKEESHGFLLKQREAHFKMLDDFRKDYIVVNANDSIENIHNFLFEKIIKFIEPHDG